MQHSFLAEPRSAVSAKAWVTLVKKCQTTVPVATRVTALESCTKLLLHDTQPQGIPPWCSSIKSTPETLCRVSEQMRQWLVHLQGHNHTTVGWEAIGGEENDKIVGENPQLPWTRSHRYLGSISLQQVRPRRVSGKRVDLFSFASGQVSSLPRVQPLRSWLEVNGKVRQVLRPRCDEGWSTPG